MKLKSLISILIAGCLFSCPFWSGALAADNPGKPIIVRHQVNTDLNIQPIIKWFTQFYDNITYEYDKNLSPTLNNYDKIFNFSTSNFENIDQMQVDDAKAMFSDPFRSVHFQNKVLNEVDSSVSSNKSSLWNRVNRGNSNPGLDFYKGTLNINNILTPDTYSNDQKQAAEKYLNFMQNLVNIEMLFPRYEAGEEFQVPVKDKDGKLILAKVVVSKDNKDQIDQIKNDSSYQSYRYMSLLYSMMKAAFMNPIMQSYQMRLPQDKGDSAYGLLNKQIMRKLGSDYATEISTASATTINREILMALNELNYQLKEVRDQNEKMLFMMAFNNMMNLMEKAQNMNKATEGYGKAFYCSQSNASSDICTNDNGST